MSYISESIINEMCEKNYIYEICINEEKLYINNQQLKYIFNDQYDNIKNLNNFEFTLLQDGAIPIKGAVRLAGERLGTAARNIKNNHINRYINNPIDSLKVDAGKLMINNPTLMSGITTLANHPEQIGTLAHNPVTSAAAKLYTMTPGATEAIVASKMAAAKSGKEAAKFAGGLIATKGISGKIKYPLQTAKYAVGKVKEGGKKILTQMKELDA